MGKQKKELEVEEVEKEEEFDEGMDFSMLTPEQMKDEDILIRANPYQYIMQHYESMYKHLGKKVWSILSLLPVSLLLPRFVINNREIRMHLNLLWLSQSGMAKSQTAREFAKITFNPILTKEMSTPRLYHELKRRKGKKVSLIVEDIAVWFMDEEKIKFLEGVTGEEESMSRENMRNIKDDNSHVELCSFCSGTPENITNRRLKEGILRRFSPLIIILSPEEHEDIIDFIASGVGQNLRLKDSEEVVNFYKELFLIQSGKHKEIPPITSYMMPDQEKLREIAEYIKALTKPIHTNFGHSSATETEEIFRLAICHAFLNIFSRFKNGLIKDGKLPILEEDINIAKKLLSREISNKGIIYQCIYSIDVEGLRTMSQLKKWQERRSKSGKKEISREAKFILESNVKK